MHAFAFDEPAKSLVQKLYQGAISSAAAATKSVWSQRISSVIHIATRGDIRITANVPHTAKRLAPREPTVFGEMDVMGSASLKIYLELRPFDLLAFRPLLPCTTIFALYRLN